MYVPSGTAYRYTHRNNRGTGIHNAAYQRVQRVYLSQEGIEKYCEKESFNSYIWNNYGRSTDDRVR